MKNLITGVVIEVLNKEHGQLVKNMFLQTFIDNEEIIKEINRKAFSATRENEDTLRFYGVDKEGNFDNYSQFYARSEELKIVTLPEFSIMVMESLANQLKEASGIDMSPFLGGIINSIRKKVAEKEQNVTKQEPVFSDYITNLINKVEQGYTILINGMEISNDKAKTLSWNLEEKYYTLGNPPDKVEAVQEEVPKVPIYRPFETVEEARTYLGDIIYGKFEENGRIIYESSQIISTMTFQNGNLLINGIPTWELLEYFVFENSNSPVGILVK